MSTRAVENTVDTQLLEAWESSVAAVAARIDGRDFTDFVTPLRPLQQRDRELIVEAPSRLAADVIRRRYQALLEESITKASRGTIVHLFFQIRKPKQRGLFSAEDIESTSATAPASRNYGLSSKYTFRNFVVGASNQFAHAACKAVAAQPGDRYNPLFIYGGVGLGKTHLATAIGHQVLGRNPATRVLYLSTDSFMNELIAAMRRNRMTDFKNRFRKIDLLILDDVQFLARRERTQEEFFHTFNSLYEARHQIVLTSDKFPKEIPDLEERLRNRFEWGLIADIQPPDLETRVAILQKKAGIERIDLPHEVALFLASTIDSNVRELEGCLTRLGAFASLNKQRINIEFARDVLRGIITEPRVPRITIESIERAVCDYFRLRPTDLRSKRRTRSIAVPRQLAMYLCRQFTDASFPAIGDRFGGRDHSTVIHATQVIETRIRTDPAFKEIADQVAQSVQRTAGTWNRSVSAL